MTNALKQILATVLGASITNIEKQTGGDINQAFVIDAGDKRYFLKYNDRRKPDMFEKEWKGLTLLGNTHCIQVPKPLHKGETHEEIFLVLEFHEKGNTTPLTWQQFGQQLAALHANSAAYFGLDHDNYIGSLPQVNRQSESWSAFYANERILLLLRKIYDDKKCDSSDTKMAEKLCYRLDELFPQEPPALLHGDLWSGNYLVDVAGQPVIFDPAVYYGHREMDIGMSLLFGGFDRSFYDHYNAQRPLEKNWRQRVDLTQLYPLLVHLSLFGGHYYQSARDILKKYS